MMRHRWRRVTSLERRVLAAGWAGTLLLVAVQVATEGHL